MDGPTAPAQHVMGVYESWENASTGAQTMTRQSSKIVTTLGIDIGTNMWVRSFLYRPIS